jgi:hypothetical protein
MKTILVLIVGFICTLITFVFSDTPVPAAPELLRPPITAVKISLQPDLQWKQVAGTGLDSATNYNLQVATDSAFDTLIWTTTNTSLTHYQIVSKILSPNTTYYWRVNALNADAVIIDTTLISAWSQVWSFTTWGNCSNATLNGIWILEIPNNYNGLYLLFDGLGAIAECGGFNGSFGIDTVWSNCTFTIHIKEKQDSSLLNTKINTFSGILINDTTAIVQSAGSVPVNWPMNKVTNQSSCEGNWSGSFIDSVGDGRLNVSVIIDNTGSVVSFSPFSGPISGKMFIQNGKMAGHIYTGGLYATSRWNQIGMVGTQSVLMPTCKKLALGKQTCAIRWTLTGVFNTDTIQNASRGSFTIGKTTPVINTPDRLTKAKGMEFKMMANGLSFELEAASNSTLKIYDTKGRFVADLTPIIRRMHDGINFIPYKSSGLSPGIFIIKLFDGIQDYSQSLIILK